jgi:AcrR family transcriptional regulator
MAEKNIKKELILVTYRLLKEHRPKDIKARLIADAAGCTAAAIYNHFNNLNHLIMLASVKFLENYIIDFQMIMNENFDIELQARATWEVFAHYAFRNVDIFEMLFWGESKDETGERIFEYYQIFPDEWKHLDGFFATMFFDNDIENRNRVMVKRMATVGYLSYEDVETINRMECNMFYGLLMNYKKFYREPGKAEEGKILFMQMLDSLLNHYKLG